MSRSSMAGLSSHRARGRRTGIGVRLASPLIVNHHQKRASSLVSPAGSSSVMDATRSGARIAWFMATQPPHDRPTRCAGRSLSLPSSSSSQAAQDAGGASGTRQTLGLGSPGMSIP